MDNTAHSVEAFVVDRWRASFNPGSPVSAYAGLWAVVLMTERRAYVQTAAAHAAVLLLTAAHHWYGPRASTRHS
jgi:hypothetical protein